MNPCNWRMRATTVLCGLAVCLIASGAVAADGVSGPSRNRAQAEQSSVGSANPAKDRTQWRKLHRRMSKDDVKRLLGDPDRISVSRFYEAWEYGGGSVTFDGKGKVDSWTEP